MKIGISLSVNALRRNGPEGASSGIKTSDGSFLKFKLPDGTGGLIKQK